MRGGTRRVRDASTSDAQNTIPNDSIAMHTIGKFESLFYFLGLFTFLIAWKQQVYIIVIIYFFYFFPVWLWSTCSNHTYSFVPPLTCVHMHIHNTLCYIDTTIITSNHACSWNLHPFECLFQHITTDWHEKSFLCVCIYPKMHIIRLPICLKSNRRP